MNYLTQDGFEKISAELLFLRTEKREEVAERLQLALNDGQDDDFVDNAELEAARNEQSFLEGRILELEDILRNYEIIEEGGKRSRTVQIGSYITLVENGFKEKEKYHLVGAAEAAPSEGRISNESPLGIAVIGAKKGDVVEVKTPSGDVIEFKVVKVE